MWVWACLFRDVLGDTKHTVDTPLPIRSFNSHVSRMVRPARYQTGKAGSVSQQSPQPTSLVVAWHLVASRTSRRRRIIINNNNNSNNIVHCKLHCFFFGCGCVCVIAACVASEYTNRILRSRTTGTTQSSSTDEVESHGGVIVV